MVVCLQCPCIGIHAIVYNPANVLQLPVIFVRCIWWPWWRCTWWRLHAILMETVHSAPCASVVGVACSQTGDCTCVCVLMSSRGGDMHVLAGCCSCICLDSGNSSRLSCGLVTDGILYYAWCDLLPYFGDTGFNMPGLPCLQALSVVARVLVWLVHFLSNVGDPPQVGHISWPPLLLLLLVSACAGVPTFLPAMKHAFLERHSWPRAPLLVLQACCHWYAPR